MKKINKACLFHPDEHISGEDSDSDGEEDENTAPGTSSTQTGKASTQTKKASTQITKAAPAPASDEEGSDYDFEVLELPNASLKPSAMCALDPKFIESDSKKTKLSKKAKKRKLANETNSDDVKIVKKNK